MKRYGFEPTRLTLTEAARKVYAETDPLAIYEYETEDGTRYDVKGTDHQIGLTEEQVNTMLEAWGSLYEPDFYEIEEV